ncbi:MAG: GatB/YqeY domain-containing protein [Armatimonadetes bacterium]|nr:GatB/YqeY domain-containing protein [Armatimonadota bacterium]
MNLLEKLNQDLKDALKNKSELQLSVIRLTKAAIKNTEIEKKRTLEDKEILEILNKEAKKRNEAILEFKKGNRLDLAQKEEKELEIIKTYLPEQMNPEEIKKLVKEIILNLTSQGEKLDLGKIMPKIMPLVKGKADGKLVNQIVQEELAINLF